MELSIRLEAIAACVKQGLNIVDIGTDHGYLPIELIRRGKCVKTLACDVRIGPLERAQQHIQEAGLTDRVEARLSNGFDKISAGEANGCVVAGMGGMLIKEILEAENQREKNILQDMQQLILQPQSDFEAVRRTVHRLSFQIVDERMLIDRDKHYWIFVCEPGRERYEADWQYRYGRILPERKDPVLLNFLQRKYSKNTELMESLGSCEREAAKQRFKELCLEQKELTEVLKLWN